MDAIRQNLLSLLIFLPMLGAAVVLCVRGHKAARRSALATTAVVFALSLLLLIPGIFDWTLVGSYGYAGSGGMVQLVQRTPLLPSIHFEYLIGVDGLSLPMVILSTLLFGLTVLASWKNERHFQACFVLLLLLETGALGALLSLDLLLHFAFIQIVLLSACALIAVWGGLRRKRAVTRFFLVTFAGSVAILVAIIAIYLRTDAFNLIALPALLKGIVRANAAWGIWVFVPLVIGYLVLLFLGWLSEAHAEAPTPASMILIGVIPTLGGYGLLRIALPMFAGPTRQMSLALALLGVASILLGTLLAMRQHDLKRLIAFSSVAQAGFVLLGASMMTTAGVGGAVFMLVAQALTGTAMMCVAGVVQDRLQHRDIDRMGGLASAMPNFTRLAALFFFASLGLPGLCNFVGQLMVLLGTFAAATTGPLAGTKPAVWFYAIGTAAAFGSVLSAGCMLWTLQRVCFGPARHDAGALSDLDQTESHVLWTLAAVMIVLGVAPWPALLMFADNSIVALVKLLGG